MVGVRVRPPQPKVELPLSKGQALDLYVHLVETADQAASEEIAKLLKSVTQELRTFILRGRPSGTEPGAVDDDGTPGTPGGASG